MVGKARILGCCEIVDTIKMLAQANHPPRICIPNNIKIWVKYHYTFQSSCQFTHRY